MKKIWTFLLILTVIAVDMSAVSKDVNGDGVVSGADVTALYGVLLDGKTVQGNADVNGDGVVSGADVTALYNYLLNGGPEEEDYEYIDIAFTGQGENGTTPTVDGVTVVNVTTGAEKELAGNAVLRLVVKDSQNTARHIHSLKESAEHPAGKLSITPEVAFADARLSFSAAADGVATVEVIDSEGNVVSGSTVNVTAGNNTAAIAPCPYGAYIVRVTDESGNVRATRWFSASKKVETAGDIAMLTTEEAADATARPKRLAAAPSATTVTMDFNRGDLLRFVARSGDMTTIMMQQPANSHTNVFSFFECKDADGYNYPIIEAGGLLWMAEDLRYVRRSGVSKVSSNSDWQEATVTKCMVINNDNTDAYYNYEGALKALPEGWRLPTGDEVNTVLRKLGGADHAGALLKAHGDDSNWGSWDEKVDSLYLRLNAHGYVNTGGNVTSHDQRGYILTSTTLSKRPMWAELRDGSDAVTLSSMGAPVDNGFHIRGVRVGFSPYKGMMDEFFSNEMQQARQRAPMAKAPVNPYSGQPIGELYTIQTGTIEMVLDWYNYRYATQMGAAGMGYGWMEGDVFASRGMFKVDLNGNFTNLNSNTDASKNLKKMALQYVPEGERIAKLVFERNNTDTTNPKNPPTSNTTSWSGNGTARIEIYNRDGSTATTVALPGTFYMPNGLEAYPFRFWGNNESTWTDYFDVYEYYAKRIQIVTADFNDDQSDDLVVGIGGRFLVIDGADYSTVIAERSFPSAATRAATGDFDGDGKPDLAVITENNGQVQAMVFCDGIDNDKLNGTATYNVGLGPRLDNNREPWLDIKIGDVVVATRNDLICQVGDVNQNRNYVAKTSVWMRQEGSPMLVPPISRATIEEQTDYLQNTCITVVHSRGMGFPADILAAGGLYRFDGTNVFSKDGTGITSIANPGGFQGHNQGNNFIYFPADNVVAGKFKYGSPNGADDIAVLSVIDAYTGWYEWANNVYWVGSQLRGLIRMYSPQNGVFSVRNIETSQDGHGAGVRVGNVFMLKERQEVSDSYTHPAFCPIPAATAHRAVYRFRDMNVTFTNPQIHAVLAAAPYYAGADYGNATAATSWGKTSSSGSGSGRSSSNSAKLIAGYNNEVGFISKAYEIDITASVEYNNTFGEESEEVITYGKEYTTFDDNSVIMTITPYFVYNYECVASDNEDAVGTMLTVGCPYYSSEQNVAMTDYMLMRADNAEIPDLSAVLHNTPGDPMSYPQYEDEIKSNCGSTIYWALPKGELQGLGQGGTATTLTHSVENSTTYTQDHELNISFELVNTIAGAKVGFGYGHSENWSSKHSTGVGHSIAGEVPAPKKFTSDISSFRWNLCRYNMLLNGQTFPVVNYVVRR